jgi:hypothetical protein
MGAHRRAADQHRRGVDMRDQMIELIRVAVDEIGADLDGRIAAPDVAATPLYGSDGPLSSLELVSVLVALEQSIEDRFGVLVTLADDQAMSQAHSPFRSFGSLADLACARVARS